MIDDNNWIKWLNDKMTGMRVTMCVCVCNTHARPLSPCPSVCLCLCWCAVMCNRHYVHCARSVCTYSFELECPKVWTIRFFFCFAVAFLWLKLRATTVHWPLALHNNWLDFMHGANRKHFAVCAMSVRAWEIPKYHFRRFDGPLPITI